MADHPDKEVTTLRGLVVKLSKEIDYKNHLLMEKKDLSLEKFATMSCLMEEKDRLLDERSQVIGSLMAQKYRLHEVYLEGMQNLEDMKLELNKVKHDLDIEKQKNYPQTSKLVEDQAETRKKSEAITTIYLRTSGRLEPPNADHIIQVEPDDSSKQVMGQKSLIIQESKRVHDEDLNRQIDILKKEFNEERKALTQVQNLNRTLISKECLSNEELESAKREAIECLLSMGANGTKIGVKRIGEIDPKPFRDACFKKWKRNWEMKFNKLHAFWQNNINDPSWNPFKKDIIDRKMSVVDENDKKLLKLRKEWGEEAYKAVVTALLELKEYNSDQKSSVSELWNFEEGRKACLKEIIRHIIQQWKIHRHKEQELSAAITGLMSEKDKVHKQLADINILMVEKDKRLNEKYAAVGKLMAQDAQKDKLLGKMSVNVSTLMEEKRISIENSNGEKLQIQHMKEHIERLNNELQSKEEKVAMRAMDLKQQKGYNQKEYETIKIKLENMDYCSESRTNQGEPPSKKFKSEQNYSN